MGPWCAGPYVGMLVRERLEGKGAWNNGGRGEGGGVKECTRAGAWAAGDASACGLERVDSLQPDCLNPFTGMIAARPGCSTLA